MKNLTAATDKVSVITSSGADIDVHCSYTESANPVTPSSNVTLGRKNTLITAAGTNDVSGSPAASSVRNIKELNLRNIDASTSNDVTVQFDENGTLATLHKVTLLAGECLVYREGIWYHYDVFGGVYGQSLPVASTTLAGAIAIATQADMEAGSSMTLAVPPGRVQYHPGVAKFWVKCPSSTTINSSYNVTSVANTATGRQTITIDTDFSSAHWSCQAIAEAASNATAVANRRNCCVANGGQAAGTVEVNCWDQTATNANLVNPTSWYVAGFGDQA